MVKSKNAESVTPSVATPNDLPSGVVGVAANERAPVVGSPLRWIMSGIYGWGVILALGVVWYDYEAGQVNWWKPTLIIAAVSLFVSGWWFAVRSSESRLEKENAAKTSTNT